VSRREFITLLGGAAVAWPLAARAQTNRVRKIGVLLGGSGNDAEMRAEVFALQKGLQELGWTEGPMSTSNFVGLTAISAVREIMQWSLSASHPM
jgi:hypothetical protein